MKRIDKVEIVQIPDYNCDTSDMGIYTDELKPGNILRATGQFVEDLEEDQETPKGREFRAFVPPDNGESVGTADYRKYALQDFERMEALQRGEWFYLGIKARATIATSKDGKDWTLNTVESGGLWGIESDSNDSDKKEMADDELINLCVIFEELGFSFEDIGKSVTNVKTVEE
jgi:hypothetical protein